MNPRAESFALEQSLPGERLDTFLRNRYPAVSRTAIQRLIDEGHIRVNGQKVKPTHQPRAGEVVSVYWPAARPAVAQPENIPLEVLHDDADLLVVNKPVGLVVHPGAGNEAHTLVNALLHLCAGKLSGVGGVARPGIVHRLDKETSGCLVVAKNDAAHLALTAQFAGRSVRKIYHAIVCGEMAHDAGDIRAAIARHPTHRKCMAVYPGEGREAWTHYQVLERLKATTLVEATIHTGRTHQIRVHFQYLGYPLLGDATYGKRQNARVAEQTGFRASRTMLHAHLLGFQHPASKKACTFTAPWPADFCAALNFLRGKPST